MLYYDDNDTNDDDAVINNSIGLAMFIGRDTVFLISHSQLFPAISECTIKIVKSLK